MNKINDRRAIYHKVIDINAQHNPWIIMVHGFTHNCNYFSAQVPDFQKDFRILLTDLRGHGKSASAAGPYGIEEYADDILMLIDELGIEKAHYWGTHTGSAIGLVLALRQPERFSSLVLEGTFLPGFPMPRTSELINRARSIAQSEGLVMALEDWFSQADWFAYIREHPQVCRAAEHRAMIFEFTGIPWLSDLTPRSATPVSEYLANIFQPTLVYNGKHDLDDFKRAALQLAAGLHKVQDEEIPDAGGFPGWENPQAVNHLVRSFLTENIEPELQNVKVGDEIPISAAGSWVMYAIEPENYFIWSGTTGDSGFTWALYPIDEHHTRLVSRIRWSHHWSPPSQLALDIFTEFTDHLAVRKILQGVKGRVEGHIESSAKANTEFAIYAAAALIFFVAIMLLIVRPLTWGRWLTGLAAGIVWLMTWYAPVSIWIGALLELLILWQFCPNIDINRFPFSHIKVVKK